MPGGQRIAQVLTQTDGGPVDHAVDVAIGLAGRGHDSHVVGPVCAGTRRAEGAGVVWHARTMTSKRDLLAGAGVARLLRDLRPDVLHLQDRRAGWIGRALAPAVPRTAVVYTLHGVADSLSDLVAGNVLAAPRRRRDALYYLHGERWITRWAGARVVSPSAAVARYAVEAVHLPPDRVDVVPNGVDTEHFSPPPRGSQHSDDDALVLSWVGGLNPVKRLDVLLDAVARTPASRLLVAGDGPLREEVRSRAARPDLAGRVEMLGHVNDPATVLTRADVHVLTSAAENSPLVLLQAMACGLPVVATSVGGVPELVRDGVDGQLCPAGDVDAVAAALASLVGHPERRRRQGAAGRARVLSGWTTDHTLDGLLESYRRAGACG